MLQRLNQIQTSMDANGIKQPLPPLRKPNRPVRLTGSEFQGKKASAVKPSNEASASPDKMDVEEPRNQLRAVIVEDEAIISMELEMLLAEMGVEVVGVAMSALEAEALVDSLRPDCVTMDINIQGPRDGVDAARDIYENYGIRSIFVSAFGDAATRERAAPANPIGWVTKPVETVQLHDILRRFEMDEI